MRHICEAVVRHISEAFVRHISEAVVRRISEAVVRHTSEAVVRPNSEAVVRPNSEAVVRHTSEAQFYSQIEHSGVAAIDLPHSQQHLLRVCTGEPVLLNEGCLVLPANSVHCVPVSLPGSHPFSLAIHYLLFFG